MALDRLPLATGIHLVGDFPLHSGCEIYQLCQAELGPRLLYYPDTRIVDGDDIRAWLAGADGAARLSHRARGSLDALEALKEAVALPAGIRASLSILAPFKTSRFAKPEDRVEPDADSAYAAWLMDEVKRVVTDLPSSSTDLAVQIKLPFADLAEATQGDTADSAFADVLLDSVTSIIEALPESIPVAVHMNCRDGAGFKIQPNDFADMTELSNRLLERCVRRIDLLHIPVPLVVSDESFFAPLRRLALRPETRLCLGLIHLSDGVEGAMRRIALARTGFPEFALAARSGFATREPAVIADFLKLHADVASACES
ncbi:MULTISPECIES: hypothetical protein [Rhizobium]|uniref:Uncharacterized protein n=1 Tax=Rhizobium miluonense TaxID=411945 RepID=A0ABU1SWZ5_9HYPH|nr:MULTISPECIES: hypothetical protein [Rhizobium]MBB3428860.1 hypothetical protein [Rhizobium sp. BK312]MDR6903513.1 hypothetical protein [Rhizobium miluonense]